MNMKKLFLLNLPYLLFVYPFDKLAQAFRLAPGADLSRLAVDLKAKNAKKYRRGVEYGSAPWSA